MSSRQQIEKVFKLSQPDDNEVIAALSSLCSSFSLTPETLKHKWEAYALNTGCPLKPSVAYIKFLKKSLQRDFDRNLKTRRTATGRLPVKRSSTMDLSEYGLTMDSQEDAIESFVSHGTFKQKKVVPLTSSAVSVSDTQLSQSSSKFITRKQSHIVENQYNPQLPARKPLQQHEPQQTTPIDVQILQSIQPYRFMFEKAREKTDNLDEQLEYVGQLILETHSEEIEAYANPTKPSQESIYAFGRICLDPSLNESEKLSEKTIMLQTSRELGMGKLVPLNLSRIEQYSLFPGQIVGVKGTNPNGSIFHAEKIFYPSVPERLDVGNPDNLLTFESMDTDNDESNDQADIPKQQPLEMIVASGPFTLNDDLSFQPLEALLSMCLKSKPEFILLMGPFLSVQHGKLATGQVESPLIQLFQEQVVERLYKLLKECPRTQVFIVPHAYDMIQPYPIFPQPAFTDLQQQNIINHERIHLLSNPSTIQLNGAQHTISIGNLDILFKIAREEISKNNATDRSSVFFKHILQQRSFHPVFPFKVDESCIMDADQLVNVQLTYRPDILILPSQLKHFVRNVEGTVCINPGNLCRGITSGTYSRVFLYPTKPTAADRLASVRVDLLKL
ncbi:DNA polymerase alpha/epsilon subunit B-domain-containing protein [Mycotypha africana]|uniref:DNA polymerase alpha/epsilon subunit B-domain-containing protein n=1 Tax=Mycotypha africana TaxID=64632 RepID=UPI002300CD6D|nr:DNA polymerase alpha/epsilon subunit B-domain-containing protein [Mycotypha africana]KAI8982344.1 DNA polymerase alpha/epsilon subunit B-domain-containing protein [Mycotypha africana]